MLVGAFSILEIQTCLELNLNLCYNLSQSKEQEGD